VKYLNASFPKRKLKEEAPKVEKCQAFEGEIR